MHHLPEDLDVWFQEWLSRNVDQGKLTTWTGRSLLKLAFAAGFDAKVVLDGRARAAMEQRHPDYVPERFSRASQATAKPSQPGETPSQAGSHFSREVVARNRAGLVNPPVGETPSLTASQAGSQPNPGHERPPESDGAADYGNPGHEVMQNGRWERVTRLWDAEG